ncbi:hypothetical protein AJ80_09663 [Polytolypa hystricis UAMH7299]|uniref:Uncharacterized protein n=1 Tax=Polytolypa hystricis (strain UAMH7299) TaxID=1447883 RepID=A0A2B7WM06_POLH7|nr:hypothetical protein AJ80_09663 [Polytolypa hystricis UAMH7299]
MAKAKPQKAQKGSGGAAQNHLRARVQFLYDAACYLHSHNSTPRGGTQDSKLNETPNESDITSATPAQKATKQRIPGNNLARLYINNMRGVSLKSQQRMSREIKRSACKRCDTLLVPDSTCTEMIENKSRGGKKPWAVVRVVRCNTCGVTKRFPQNTKRSARLAERRKKAEEEKKAQIQIEGDAS